MDRSDVSRDDEAWIAKYRAALEGFPVQPAGGMKVRARNTCQIVLLGLRKVLRKITVWDAPKSVASSGPRPVQPKAVLQTGATIRRVSPPEVSRKPPAGKKGTTVRSGASGSSGKSPSQRQA
jgi:hypothetical protein